MAKSVWKCLKCGGRFERARNRVCPNGCGTKARPKRVPKHAQTLRDDSYEVYVQVSKDIHGVSDESCCVCGKERSLERRHDRDHDHVTGHPRGLACHRCNRVMVKELTLERAQAIVDYLARVESFYRSHDEQEEAA
jgi:DNA-directed RNA polymerase subunit RPC12/RpoP